MTFHRKCPSLWKDPLAVSKANRNCTVRPFSVVLTELFSSATRDVKRVRTSCDNRRAIIGQCVMTKRFGRTLLPLVEHD